MKFIRGYKSIALVQIFMCVCFFFHPGFEYGTWFAHINFVGAGVLFFGSLLAYFDTAKKWTCWLLIGTMITLIAVNTPLLIIGGTFLTTGFSLIAYDILFVVGNLHFLGKGL